MATPDQPISGTTYVGSPASAATWPRTPLGFVKQAIFGGNRYDRGEFAGAFGDLGTFIPFVVAYITVNKMDPLGILLGFGIFKIFVGLYFKTPVSVQPMKAIGGAAIAHPEMVTSGMIWGSGLFTAAFWAVMALTGAITWLEKITAKPVIRGIMLGLGMSFIIDAVGLAKDQPLLAVAAVALTFLFLTNERVPAMLLLLALGIVYSFVQNPSLVGQLSGVSLHFRLPEFALGKITWNDLVMGTLILGLPQVPLTLGNAILGIVAENNELFPDRPMKVKTVALDHGFMNIVSTAIGGVPLCHGAGGMAGHVRFGARTGGALVILGLIVTFTGLFLLDSVALLFGMVPTAVLGVILFFTGLELASIVRDIGSKKEDIYVMLVTAGLAIVNMGVGFLAGVVLHCALRKGIVKL
ncbi:MAG: putative sulfate/molybdate transporter [Chloroflexi bacterium]|nr:putative sulfate/molybdate transporter [Chloroflexota bacterium]MCL5108015.1 putative sulfate/molybdate transporter [Chloroflexota bacterium]